MSSLNEQELKVKVGQRGTSRASATKAVKSAQAAMAETPPSIDKARTSLNLLKNFRDKLEALDEIILPLVAEDKLDNELQRAQQYQDDIGSCLASLDVVISNLSMPPAPPSSPPASSHRDTAPKLPKLEIPKFSGDPLLWEQFWDNFKACIHDRTDLPDIDKFKYLKSFLEDEALRMADGYRLTVVNYDEVLQALKERFGDPEMAIFAHFEALISLQPSNSNLSELRNVLDTCESHIRSLVALGLPETTFGVVFTPLILSKLPKGVKMELYRKNGTQRWTLANLRTLLKDEISAREKCERLFAGHSEGSIGSQNQTTSKKKFSRNGSSRKPLTTSTSLLSSPAKSQDKQSTPLCVYCSNRHYSGDCRTYPDVNSRRSKLQDRCFCCLRVGHNASQCRSKRPCYFCRRETHHQSLCPKQFGSRKDEREETMVAAVKEPKPAAKSSSSTTAMPESNLSLQSPNSKAILQTAIADIRGTTGRSKARFYFDTGGSRSFISTEMAKKIGAKFIAEESVAVGRFRDSQHSTISYRIYEFDVCLPNGKAITVRMSAEKTISCPIQLIPIQCSAFANVKLAEPLVTHPTMVPIDVLIGNDYYYQFIGESQVRCPNGIVLLESPFGFITAGALSTKSEQRGFESSLFLHAVSGNSTADTIERFWKLEELEIKDNPYQTDDELALKSFNDSVKYEDGRYAVKWPWKEENPELEDNYALSFGRLKSLMKRIGNDEQLFKKYDDTIKEQQIKGIIEVCPEENDGMQHYLPHHCVITPSNTTTKLRVVYDASAKASKQKLSLNECLHRGPVFMADLAGILIRWRLPKIAIVSDIEKAFLQVSLQRSDRDVTRFLWVKDPKIPVSQANLQTFRFCRVPFGVISSPFLLAATLTHHLKRAKDPVASSILANVYVDNVFGGAKDELEALSYYKSAKFLLAGAAMNLREWFSNSAEFLAQIEQSDRGNKESTTVLGLKWDIGKDELSIPAGNLLVENASDWTKRRVLKSLASVFDPCGLLSPVVINGKLLMQKLWKQKCDWDDMLPEELQVAWDKVYSDLLEIPSVSIPRQQGLSIDKDSQLQLHCFCDAAKSAFCAVVYLRNMKTDTVSSDLVFAKSRVAPVKSLSIPRLELLAVLIGVRALKFVETEIHQPVSSLHIWTDSSCVLAWIKRKPVSTTFVQNRLREICSYPEVEFGYVPTAQNPADLPTRGIDCQQIRNNKLWWHGPTWLLLEKDQWPKEKPCNETLIEDVSTASLITTGHHNSSAWTPSDNLLDLKLYSSLGKVLRITSYCFRFSSACRKKNPQLCGPISAQELTSAQQYWEHQIQAQCFGHNVESENYSRQKRLPRAFVDSRRLIRCHVRQFGSQVSDENDCPVLLPKGHPYTDLVILHCHETVLHSGVKHTLAELRRKYWVIHSRSQVKRVLKNCKLCRLYDGQPFQTPSSASLPEFRVQPSKPFDAVGIDYLGPLLIRTRANSETSKVWICLFTCATTRAVHLEVIENLTTEHFLLCYRRFMATYGRPRLIISDNAKHFHSANQALQRIWRMILNSDEVQSLSSQNHTSWKFITELAPWMGGFYERMVGLVKTSLKKSLHNRCLTVTELQTVICEITSVINTRPLLYLEELLEQDYLSPAHFLMKVTEPLPIISVDEEYTPKPIFADELITKWKRIQVMLDEFWKSWQSSYLQSLRDYVWNPSNRNTTIQTPAIGTVVIIKDTSRRGTWKLGLITELIKSHDGVVRSVVLRLSSGSQLRRPIKLLTPLESSIDPIGIGIDIAELPTMTRSCSTRAAALKATKQIRRQLDDGSSDEKKTVISKTNLLTGKA